MEIKVVDYLMGCGKTTAMINYMVDNLGNERKYIYVTPYLTEVRRILAECEDYNFKEPQIVGTKLHGLKELLRTGENIISTHALFKLFDYEVAELVEKYNYTLVMDEVIDLVESIAVDKTDSEVLKEYLLNISEDGTVSWRYFTYGGAFKGYKNMFDRNNVKVYNEHSYMWMYPPEVFRAFKEVYLLTFMFKSQVQRCYFDYFGFDYSFLYVCGNEGERLNLTDVEVPIKYPDYSKLINIEERASLNRIGRGYGNLSYTWYSKYRGKPQVRQVQLNLSNYYKNILKINSEYTMWTTFKDFKDELSGRGYTKGYIPSNMRATNAYLNRTAVAYTVNKFINPYVKQFFKASGIEIDEDSFALSELLQFIWRSAIRVDEPIEVYVPSQRMRSLLMKWINEKCEREVYSVKSIEPSKIKWTSYDSRFETFELPTWSL